MMKRILSAFLISCVYLSAWSWTGSGTKEDPWVLTETMTAVLDDGGTLTIRGTGDMPDGGGSIVPYESGRGAVGDDIRSVTLPWEANSSALQAVVIDIGVRSIGNYAFTNCSNLASVKISEGVERIGGYAFKGCTRLASVTIPKGVTRITMGAFEDCTNLASVMFCSNVSRNDIMVSRPISRSIFYGCTSLTSVVFAKGVTRIGDNLLGDCTSLTSVTIPEGVTDIGWHAFSGCTSLASVTLPKGVMNIEEAAFSGCTSLASVTLPKGVMNIEEAAFDGCTSLASVSIPEGVSNIGWYAFRGCASLVSVTIPEGVSNVGRFMFSGCASLVSVTISEGVTNIQENAFEDCDSLMSVTIPEGVTGIGAGAFSGCGRLKSVTIPDSMTNIEMSVFRDCTGLTSIVIPRDVTNIGSGAFAGCGGLKDVYFSGVVPPLVTSDAFSSCNADLILHAPRGWTGRTRILGGVYLVVDGEVMDVQQVNMTVTNVVVNYVLNSVQPDFANPSTADTGFVNVITEVKGGCVAVPSTWADNYPSFIEKFGRDFTKALSMRTGKKDGAGNDMFVWQDYVAGTDPTKLEDKFTASITVVNGTVTVSYTPELDDDRKALRKYTTWGKKSLLDTDWTVVQEGQEAGYNFFKVSVEMK